MNDPVMPFGKHAGKSQYMIADLYPYYYLTLCRKNPNFTEDLRDPAAVSVAKKRARR